MEPRPPRPSKPSVPPMAEPVAEEAGETSRGPRTAVGKSGSDVIITPAREPQVGDHIGPYLLIDELGRGGMAVVFKSKDPVLPRDIALKVMLASASAGDPHAKARFLREAGAQAKVEHPHIVAIYQAGEWHGVPFIAMPALKGQTLAARLKKLRDRGERLPVAELLRIGREIAEGLEAAHAKNLVHRDIKPGNIWLEDPKAWVKILDFGLAHEESVVPEGDGEEFTKFGAVVGTPSYMSPEQAKGMPVDARTDLWSLGVVLYQMATGEKPFNGSSPYNVLISVIQDEPLPPDAPDLPPAFIDLIQNLLSKLPEERISTAAEVVAKFAAIEKALQAPTVIHLPADGSATAAPTVWGALDETEHDDAPAPKPTREPRSAPKADRTRTSERAAARTKSAPPRALPWAWIAGGAGLAVVLLGVLIWFAVQPTKPAKKDETVTPKQVVPDKKGGDKKAPPPPPPPPNDRRAAEAFRERKATLVIQPDGAPELTVKPDEPLPPGKFELIEVNFGTEKLYPAYAADVLLPNIAGLKSLSRIRMSQSQIELSAEQVKELTAMPLAATLTRLETYTPLTPKSLADLKKFRALRDLTGFIPVADDALFLQLGEFKNLVYLTIVDLRQSDDVTEKGWSAVGKLPLEKLLFYDSRISPTAFRALTAKGGQRALVIAGGALDDAALQELSGQPSDLAQLFLWGLKDVTDEGMVHLETAKSLKQLLVAQCGVTDAGMRALKAKRPEMKIERQRDPTEPRG